MQTDVLHKGTAAFGGDSAPREKGRFEWSWVVIGLCVAITVYIAIVPLGFLVWQSFFTPQTADKAAVFTLSNYTEAYGSSETWRLFRNAGIVAIGTSTFSCRVGPCLR